MRQPCFFVAVVALVAVVAPAAAQEFLLLEGLTVEAGSPGCRPQAFQIPRLDEPWNVRMSVVSDPPDAALNLAFYFTSERDHYAGSRTIGSQSGAGGYLEVTARLQPGPQRRLAVCVGAETQPMEHETAYTVYGHWLGQADRRAPSASDSTEFDDDLYRDVIFNGYHDPAGVSTATSSVLYGPTPQFYIRLGGPEGCGAQPRVPYSHLHYWRAIVPVLAEQLTGVPYHHAVEAGCEPRAARYGWVTVEYATPEEHSGNWGGRARLGAIYGRIWIRWNPPTRTPAGHLAVDSDPGITPAQRELITHEIGHAFGLQHTDREGAIMQPGAWVGRDIFSPAEEDSARRAYAVGRGARYCGDPGLCGTGNPPGFRFRPADFEEVIVVVD